MNARTVRRLATLGAVYATLNASDDVADHWVQTDTQAQRKGDRSPEGQRACAAHVATYTATRVAALATMAAVTGARLPLARTGLILGLDAASHYWADRRYTLKGLRHRPLRAGPGFPSRDAAGLVPADRWRCPVIAYFERQLLPGLDPTGVLPHKTVHIPAIRGHEAEQWDDLAARTDPALYTLAPHRADGAVCGLDDQETTR